MIAMKYHVYKVMLNPRDLSTSKIAVWKFVVVREKYC